MILVCGDLADPVAGPVCARLDGCGYPYRLLDLREYPAGYEIKWHWNGANRAGYIAGPGWRLELDELTSVFVRYIRPEGRQAAPTGDEAACHAPFTEIESGLMAILEQLPCTVVNRLAGGMSNHSKTYQSLLVRECGLLTPPTLVTNDAIAVRAFHASCGGDVVFKSLSGVRSIVKRVDGAQLERLALLHRGPAQFQAFVPGDNVRVHTVGRRLFATRVVPSEVGSRYPPDGRNVLMEPFELPDRIAAACLRLSQRLDLVLAGIDLKVTPEGEYYCFDVNPAPGFPYYERGSGQPIGEALAELLRANACPAQPTIAVRARMSRRPTINADRTRRQ